MPQNFLEALGARMGQIARDAESSARTDAANLGGAINQRRQELLDQLQGIGRDLGSGNPGQTALGAIGVPATIAEVSLNDVLNKPLEAATTGVGLTMNVARKAFESKGLSPRSNLNPLSLTEARKSYEGLPMGVRLPVELASATVMGLGGPAGANLAAKLGAPRAVQLAEAAPGELMGAALQGVAAPVARFLQSHGIGVDTVSTRARKAVDQLRQQVESALQVLRASGQQVSEADFLRTMHGVSNGEAEAVAQQRQWDQAVESFLQGQRGDAIPMGASGQFARDQLQADQTSLRSALNDVPALPAGQQAALPTQAAQPPIPLGTPGQTSRDQLNANLVSERSALNDVPQLPAGNKALGDTATPIQAIGRLTKAQNGGTFDPRTLQPVNLTQGYMVGDPRTTRVLDLAAFTPHALQQYIADHADDLAQPGTFLGTWIDQGKVYLDTPRVIQDAAEAARLGTQRGEQAIWDNAGNAQIRLTIPAPPLVPEASQGGPGSPQEIQALLAAFGRDMTTIPEQVASGVSRRVPNADLPEVPTPGAGTPQEVQDLLAGFGREMAQPAPTTPKGRPATAAPEAEQTIRSAIEDLQRFAQEGKPQAASDQAYTLVGLLRDYARRAKDRVAEDLQPLLDAVGPATRGRTSAAQQLDDSEKLLQALSVSRRALDVGGGEAATFRQNLAQAGQNDQQRVASLLRDSGVATQLGLKQAPTRAAVVGNNDLAALVNFGLDRVPQTQAERDLASIFSQLENHRDSFRGPRTATAEEVTYRQALERELLDAARRVAAERQAAGEAVWAHDPTDLVPLTRADGTTVQAPRALVGRIQQLEADSAARRRVPVPEGAVGPDAESAAQAELATIEQQSRKLLTRTERGQGQRVAELDPIRQAALDEELALARKLKLVNPILNLAQKQGGTVEPAAVVAALRASRPKLSAMPEGRPLESLVRSVLTDAKVKIKAYPKLTPAERATMERTLRPEAPATAETVAPEAVTPPAAPVAPVPAPPVAEGDPTSQLRALFGRLQFPREAVDEYLRRAQDPNAVRELQQLVGEFLGDKEGKHAADLLKRAAAERSGTATLGAFAGVGQDEQGNATFDPQAAGTGLVVGALVPREKQALLRSTRTIIRRGAKDLNTAKVAESILYIPRGAATADFIRTANAFEASAKRQFPKQAVRLYRAVGQDGERLAINVAQGRRAGIKQFRSRMLATAKKAGAESALEIQIGRGHEPLQRLGVSAEDDATRLMDAMQQSGAYTHVWTEPNLQAGGFEVVGLSILPPQGGGRKYVEAARAMSDTLKRTGDQIASDLGITPLHNTVLGAVIKEHTLATNATKAAAQSAGAANAAIPGATGAAGAIAHNLPAQAPQLGGAFEQAGLDSAALKQAADLLGGSQATVADDISRARQALDAIASHQGRQFDSLDALLADKAAVEKARAFNPDDLKTLQQLQGKYRGKDLLSPETDPQALADQLSVGQLQQTFEPTTLERVGQAAGKNPVFQALGQVNRLYRPLALLSPRFHVLNASDQAFKSWVGEGVKAWLHDSDLAKMLTAWEQVKDPARVAELAAPGKLNKFGSLTRTSEGVGLIEAPKSVVDGFGRSMDLVYKKVPFVGKAEQINRSLTTWLEESARLSAYAQGKQQFLLTHLDEFSRDVERAAGPDAAQQFIQSKGLLGPKGLGDILAQAAPQERTQLLAQWQRLLRMGDTAGEKLSTRIHFNYRYTNNIDQFLANVMLFHTFATRNLVYYPQILASHPGVALALAHYGMASEQQRQDKNLTSSAVGMVPGGDLGDKVAGMLFGPNAELLVNPANYLSFVQQVTPMLKQAVRPEEDKGLVGAPVEGLGNVGLSLTPPAQVALQVANNLTGGAVVGPDNNALYGLLPQSGTISNLIGAVRGQPADIEAPLKALLGIQGGNEGMVRRRLAEMAVEAGTPGAYDGFMADPSNPLYQQAAAQVAHAQGLRSGLSFLTGAQVKPVSAGERQVREAKKGHPTFQPNASPLERFQYGQQSRQAIRGELIQEVQANPGSLLRRMVTELPTFRAYLYQHHVTPEDAARMAPQEQQTLLLGYVTDPLSGPKPLTTSQAYSGASVSGQNDQTRALQKQDEQAIVQRYLASGPADQAVMLRDPNTAYVIAKYLIGRGAR